MWTMTSFSAKSSDILPTLLKMPEALIKGEEKANDNEAYVKNLDTPNKKIIKVMDFEKEKKSEDKNLTRKIKIKTF